MSPANPPKAFPTRRLICCGLILLCILDATIRWRLRTMPFERDEGEFAYGAQLLLHGDSPYKHAYNDALKLPGTCGAYAVIMAVLGQTPSAVHIGVMLVNLATAWLVFLLCKRLSSDLAGMMGAGIFILLTLTPTTLGLAAHATHFVMLPAVAGILLLQDLDGRTSALRIFLAGLCIGLAVVMKQTAAPFGLFAAGWVAWLENSQADKNWLRAGKRLLWLFLGGALPLALTIAIIALSGDFSRFWLWTVQYAGLHGTLFNWTTGTQWMMHCLAGQFMDAPTLWSFAILGLLLLFFVPSLKPARFFVGSFVVCSFLAVCPGWYFRGHYFIQLFPAMAVLAAIAFKVIHDFSVRQKFPLAPQTIPVLLFACAVAATLIHWSDIYFRLTPVEASRALYGTNPFPEAVEVGAYLSSHCPSDKQVAVIGSEPEIYVYSQRRAATGYICTYPMMEAQPFASMMRDEMFREIETADPAYVVFVNVPGSWIQSTGPINRTIFDWFAQYSAAHLQFIGYVETLPDNQVKYHWFEGGESYPPPVDYSLAVFRRK